MDEERSQAEAIASTLCALRVPTVSRSLGRSGSGVRWLPIAVADRLLMLEHWTIR